MDFGIFVGFKKTFAYIYALMGERKLHITPFVLISLAEIVKAKGDNNEQERRT